MPTVAISRADLISNLIDQAKNRGASLSHKKADAAVQGLQYMKEHGYKLHVSDLRGMLRNAHVAAHKVCSVLNECKGIDSTPYLVELNRLDVSDKLDAIARWRAQRPQIIFPSRSPVMSDASWTEANGH